MKIKKGIGGHPNQKTSLAERKTTGLQTPERQNPWFFGKNTGIYY